MKNIELITIEQDAQLPHNIAEQLHKKLHYAQLKEFSDGQFYVGLSNPVIWQNKTAIIIQSTVDPVNQFILQVSFLAHELKNAGAQKVFVVMPYFGYSRQERSDIEGKPGPAQVIAHMYQGAGIDYMMMVELHTDKIQDFFVIPTFNIMLNDLIAQHIKETFDVEKICLIAPDQGAQDRVATIAHKVGCSFNIFTKERYDINKTRIVAQAGACRAEYAIIIDDIIDTGGTAIQVADQLMKQDFDLVYGYFIHGVLSGNALERIEKSAFTKLFISNTIEQKRESQKIQIFDISIKLTDAIKKYV